MELGTGSMTLCELPRKNHAASGVRIRFVRRRLAVGKRGDRIAAFLNATLETDGPAALQAAPGVIAKAAGSLRQEESPGREERSMRSRLGHPSAFGRLSTSGPSRPPAFGPLIRIWSPASHPRLATSPR